MILLDTNVLSALMLREPDRTVVEWLDTQPAESIWTTSITVFEIRTGLALLPAGRRRDQLEQVFDALLDSEIEGRIQTFDRSAALAAATAAATRHHAGSSMEVRDAEIAGITLARRATLATRNIRRFSGLGLELVNPWAA